MTTLSFIIPVFNEAESIRPFVDRIHKLRPALERVLSEELVLELLFVNDGSLDKTREVVEAMSAEDPELKLINLSRNFGKEAALSAGLHHATGDAVVPLDVDLQDPPEIVAEMVAKWRNGAKVVNARRSDRSSDSIFKRSTANMFYKLLERIADQPVHAHVGDFRLFDRQAVSALNQLNENTRFNKGLFSWIGFEVAEVEIVRAEREHGETKWGATKLWSLALDGITSSTTLPLRIWTYLGAIIAAAAFVYAAVLIGYTLLTGGDMPGFASIMVAVLFLGGMNLLSLGLMGEYIGRIAKEVRQRPLYIVESKVGF